MKNENIARKSGNVAPTERKTTASQIQIGGNFQLVDQEGNTRKLTEFRGKYVVLYFGFANCPDYCPTELKKLSQALENLGELGFHHYCIRFVYLFLSREITFRRNTANFHLGGSCKRYTCCPEEVC